MIEQFISENRFAFALAVLCVGLVAWLVSVYTKKREDESRWKLKRIKYDDRHELDRREVKIREMETTTLKRELSAKDDQIENLNKTHKYLILTDNGFSIVDDINKQTKRLIDQKIATSYEIRKCEKRKVYYFD